MRPIYLAATTLGAALAALSPTSASAQTQPLRALPETVVTATRIPTPLERIAAGVTVIDRETIERRGYQTLADALSPRPWAQAALLWRAR
jgi:vitamin B12 transporter